MEVVEDDLEIGQPEKCDGLVSQDALSELHITPTLRAVQNRVRQARLHSPGGVTLEIDARRQEVLVLDRSELDRQLAVEAHRAGATLETGVRFLTAEARESRLMVSTDEGSRQARVLIDATGCASLSREQKKGTLQAGRYEVAAPWVEPDVVDLYFDRETAPGFFVWLIPIEAGFGKLGVAGTAINPFRALDAFVNTHKPCSVLKKIAAPVVVGGPVERFVDGRILRVGDAAGQCKPTTAGGIYSGGKAGFLAGKAAAEYIQSGDAGALAGYEQSWRRQFDKEFRQMRFARRVLEGLSNEKIDVVFRTLAQTNVLGEISETGDFDWHSPTFVRALGLRQVASLLGATVVAELGRLARPLRRRET